MNNRHLRLCLLIIATAGTMVFASAFKAKAQDDTQYLIDIKKYKLTGFGSTNHEFSMVDGAFGVSSGSSGAFLFDYKFFVGMYNRNLITNHYYEDIYSDTFDPEVNPAENPLYNGNRIRFEHGGLWVGYVHNPNKLFHLGANIQLGGGRIALYDKDVNYYDFEEHHRDIIGVVTPEIDVEVNIARWFKVNLGVGYRFVLFVNNDSYVNSQGESLRLFKTNQFSSPLASVKLMFGVFGPKKNGKKAPDLNQ